MPKAPKSSKTERGTRVKEYIDRYGDSNLGPGSKRAAQWGTEGSNPKGKPKK
jgi:hypothetical protein